MVSHNANYAGCWPACGVANARPIAREVECRVLDAGVSAHEVTAPRAWPWSESAPLRRVVCCHSMTPMTAGMTRVLRTILADMMFDMVTVHAMTRLCMGSRGSQY